MPNFYVSAFVGHQCPTYINYPVHQTIFVFQAAFDDWRQPETGCAMERWRFADMVINQRGSFNAP